MTQSELSINEIEGGVLQGSTTMRAARMQKTQSVDPYVPISVIRNSCKAYAWWTRGYNILGTTSFSKYVIRWKVRSGVEMRNMRNLVKYCVSLIGDSKSRPFHDIGRYYMTKKISSTNGCYRNYCNHGNRTSY